MTPLAVIRFTVEVREGQSVQGTPRIDVVEDNLKDVIGAIPDGVYKWQFTLDINSAEKE